MYTFLVILFVFSCLSMIMVILLQSSKGQGLAGTFGGSGGSAVFGGRGAATFLSRTTTILATLYMILCLLISFVYKSENEDVRDSLIQQEAAEQPTMPVTDVPFAPIQTVSDDTTR